MYSKPLLLSLIKDDLIHARLLLGLEALGLRTDDYTLSISERVFELMGITDDERGEALYERYLEMRGTVLGLAPGEAGMDGLAEEMYALLERGGGGLWEGKW